MIYNYLNNGGRNTKVFFLMDINPMLVFFHKWELQI